MGKSDLDASSGSSSLQSEKKSAPIPPKMMQRSNGGRAVDDGENQETTLTLSECLLGKLQSLLGDLKAEGDVKVKLVNTADGLGVKIYGARLCNGCSQITYSNPCHLKGCSTRNGLEDQAA